MRSPSPIPDQPAAPTQPATSLRASDADRNLVVDLLSAAYADGRITLEEHQDRTTAAYSAKTFDELNQLTGDLIIAEQPQQYVTQNRPSQLLNPTGDTLPESAFRVFGDIKRIGPWHVPAHTEVKVVFGDAMFSFLDSTFEQPRCTFNLNTYFGDVQIIVPEGVEVVQRVSQVFGDLKYKGIRNVGPNRIVVELTGRMFFGDLIIHGPDSTSRVVRKHLRHCKKHH